MALNRARREERKFNKNNKEKVSQSNRRNIATFVHGAEVGRIPHDIVSWNFLGLKVTLRFLKEFKFESLTLSPNDSVIK